MTQKGDWSKLTDYLNSIKFGQGLKPKQLVLTQEDIRTITGSVQKAPLYSDHTTNKDIKDRANAAGYTEFRNSDGDFVFT